MKGVILTFLLIFVARGIGDGLDFALGTTVIGSGLGSFIHHAWLITSGGMIGALVSIRVLILRQNQMVAQADDQVVNDG